MHYLFRKREFEGKERENGDPDRSLMMLSYAHCRHHTPALLTQLYNEKEIGVDIKHDPGSRKNST